MGGNSTNVVDVDYLDRISDSYKATIELMGRQANTSASSAFSMIHIRGNYFFDVSKGDRDIKNTYECYLHNGTRYNE